MQNNKLMKERKKELNSDEEDHSNHDYTGNFYNGEKEAVSQSYQYNPDASDEYDIPPNRSLREEQNRSEKVSLHHLVP